MLQWFLLYSNSNPIWFFFDSLHSFLYFESLFSEGKKSWKNLTLSLTLLRNFTRWEIFSNRVAFSQYLNFMNWCQWFVKVQLFWEDHKNLRILPYGFDIYLLSKHQNHEEDCANFCGLLKCILNFIRVSYLTYFILLRKTVR